MLKLWNWFKNLSTPHTRDRTRQSIWSHGWYAFKTSTWIIVAGLAGYAHGIAPEVKALQFWTARQIFKIAVNIFKTRRHDDDVLEMMGPGVLAELKRRFPEEPQHSPRS